MAQGKDVMRMVPYALSFLLTSLVMSAMILMIFLLHALFPKVFPAKLRYAVWLVVLVGLIVPLRPAVGGGLVAVPLPAAAQMRYEAPGDLRTFPPAETDSAQGITDAEAADRSPAGRPISPVTVCVLVWGAVAAVMFASHLWRYVRFVGMIRRWGVTVKEERVLRVLRSVLAEKGLGDKKIGLKMCGFVSSSMLTGLIRPVILLPEKRFDEDELELIFRHELIHYKRHDLIVKLLSVLAISIHWFNPVVYLMCAATQAEGEASCDEAVLLEAGKENRQFYAEVIIGMIGGKNRSGTLLSTCFYGGKSSIKRRLDSIMDTTRKIKRPAAPALAAVAVLTVLSGSVFAFSVKEPSVAAPLVAPETAVAENGKITAERAKEIALATVGGGTVVHCVNGLENGREVYRIEILYGEKRYSMGVDAAGSTVSDYRWEAVERTEASPASAGAQAGADTSASGSTSQAPAPAPAHPDPAAPPPEAAEITAEQAKDIALERVGGGTVIECELDYENGRSVYEIKIRFGNTEYEMDIDVLSGSISDYSADRDYDGHND